MSKATDVIWDMIRTDVPALLAALERLRQGMKDA